MTTTPVARYGLRGRVVTMDDTRTVLADGIIWVADGVITDVTAATERPAAHAGSAVVATAGTIYPGLIELHNHLAYNALPLFPIPRQYTKREEWQGTRGYRRYVSGPAGVIASVPELIRATIRYVECKSLIAGTTTSQGLTLRAAPIKQLYRGIVRNAEVPDAANLHPARPKIGDVTPDDRDAFRKSLAGAGARIVHLAEGLPTSPGARQHFLDLEAPDGTWAIGPSFVGIHATALTGADLAVLARHSGSIVWSPFSNLALYGDTTDIGSALRLGINVALGSDWSPTASKNLLHELKVARILSDDRSDDRHLGLTDQQLVEMVTVSPARILGWQQALGSIEPTKLADLTVVKGRTGNPYRHLVDAVETDILLVVIGGVARYGTPALLARLSPVDETVDIAGSTRALHLDTADPDPVLGRITLGQAAGVLADALAHMPERAAAIGTADLGLVVDGGFAGADADRRWYLQLDQPPIAGIAPALFEGTAPALLDLVLGAETFASIAVPLTLDPLATEGDDAFFQMLANLTNVPEAVRSQLPGRYGETPRTPTEGLGRPDDDIAIAPLPLEELLTRTGDLTLADRRLIVEQAIVILEQAYVHLPVKRARYAVDPVQRLRLMQNRLMQAQHIAELGPESTFHAELIDIFTSLRDLHTHYVPPEPYRSHTLYLPFLVEECTRDGRQQYIVSKVATGTDLDPTFCPGVEVTHWNGTPIRRAVERNADHQGGGNLDARMARGLDALTIRTLGRTPLPDEEWVDVTYRTRDDPPRAYSVRARWNTYQPREPSPLADNPRTAPGRLAALGVDAQTSTVNLVRRDLYTPIRSSGTPTGADELATELPDALRARIRPTSHGDVLHLRIFTFLVADPDEFVDEFLRLTRQRPAIGLIVDVRGNGGGDIRAAEQLLQVLTPRRIQPEPAQFIVSPLTRRLCQANARDPVNLSAWAPSVLGAVETGATFSTGFPIGAADQANQRGQGYYGPVVLITDARCYSATDIFAAGFQDHTIGPVLGVSEHTGAGGANVWTHDLLHHLLRTRNAIIKPLPRQATFRVAVRRTTRVGPHAGQLLEDLGVRATTTHAITDHDLLADNKDLIEAAARLMAGKPVRQLDATFESRGDTVAVDVRTAHLDRLDAYLDNRPIGSWNITNNQCSFDIDVATARHHPLLRLEGYDRNELAAVRQVTIPFPATTRR
jgi:cytosine/adenosine deaminase-related metal-dependent hydrolase/C-terminal processing protease CtpA/Prc